MIGQDHKRRSILHSNEDAKLSKKSDSLRS